ncbi:MAG: DUF3244 domain-containing protein [Bacteroidia bacterium]|nr:DUF3244 domain-containing protein [Bacteroidia bacterium]
MKKQTPFIFISITILLLIVCCSWGIATNNTTDILSVNEQNSSNKIKMQGNIKTRGGFRSGTDPIVVEQQGTTLSILFQKDVAILLISIIGLQGEVYVATVDTSTQSTLIVPLAGLPTGNYTITFNNERGMIWGEFMI